MKIKTAPDLLADASLRLELALATARIAQETLDSRRTDKGMAETMTIIHATISRSLEEISFARELILHPPPHP